MNEQLLIQSVEGECSIISHVHGNNQIAARLQELGFVEGQWIRVIKQGNPSIIQIGDSRFCLRQEQLACIAVIPYAGCPNHLSEQENTSKLRTLEPAM